MPWKSPTKVQKKRALIGSSTVAKSMYKEIFPSGVRNFFEISHKTKSSAFFKEIDNSDPSDWLLNHKEDGQSYEDFWTSRLTSGSLEFACVTLPLTAKIRKKTICLLPIGPFPCGVESAESERDSEMNPLMHWLESYCKAFFSTAKVVMLQPATLSDVACDYRVNKFTGRFQLNATQILGYLRRRKTSNQDCLVGVTMVDLFPKESWNFVFGLASTSKSNVGGVGVFSFCRYEDHFYGSWRLSEDVVKTHEDGTLDYSVFVNQKKRTNDSTGKEGSLLLRACKVMTHEVCHMFGLKHCIWMQCLMNGTNHLQESDRRPPHLCPVCLRKLQLVLNFDTLERYKTLLEWTKGAPWKERSPSSLSSAKSDISDTESSHSGSTSSGSLGPGSKKKPSGRKSTKRRSLKSSNYRQADPKPQRDVAIPSRRDQQQQPSSEIPPLESFSDYKLWLRDAIEFIISGGKRAFLPSASDEF